MSQFAYDQVPYTSHPFAQTHPQRLATIATLLGMSPAPVDQCRVLELGCGDGSNLFPMAEAFPESKFVGIDLAESAINQGRALIADLQLNNLEMRHEDILEVAESIGKFDYIIAHGVYSWVPSAVKNRLLELCRHHLTEQGVAYVSYNAYPGFYFRQISRDMMRVHTRDISEPVEKVQQGLALLQLISKKFASPEEAEKDLYGHLISSTLKEFQEYLHPDGIYHDALADENTAVYFYQFASHAAQYGLQYLSEADFYETQEFMFPPEVRAVLDQFDDQAVILKEQYMDYLKCRTFRQTLLCRQEVKIDRTAQPDRIRQFFIGTPKLQHATELNLTTEVVEEFKASEKTRLSTDFPMAKAALLEMSESAPRPLKFDELLERIKLRLGQATEFSAAEVKSLQEILFSAYCANFIQLYPQDLKISPEVAVRPKTTKLVRRQAAHRQILTNLLHLPVEIESVLVLKALELFDGQHEPLEIVARLLETPEAAVLKNEQGFTTHEELKIHLEKNLPEMLENLRKKALLKA